MTIDLASFRRWRTRIQKVRRWLDRDRETCPFCGRVYPYQCEFRCSACSGPVCPQCVLMIERTRQIYCPRCGPRPRMLA